MIVSLRQPVLVNNQGNVSEENKYCQNQPVALARMNSYSLATKNKILRAISILIATNQQNRYNINFLSSKTLDDPSYYNPPTGVDLVSMLSNIGIPYTDIIDILKATPAAVAAGAKSCFLPAPVQRLAQGSDLNGTVADVATGAKPFFEQREQLAIRPLMINMQSLAVWNRDGVYLDFPTENPNTVEQISGVSALSLLNATTTTDGYLWIRQPADPLRPGTLAESGLAATSLIIHNSYDTPPIRYDRNEPFVYNGASNLPAPTTIVSDYSIYTQGDWNSVSKQPSAIMADSFTLLSNSCLATTNNYMLGANFIPKGQLTCGLTSGMNLASDTIFNAAIFSGVNEINATNRDSTPIRFLEDWTARRLTARTSYVINGSPLTTHNDSSSFISPGSASAYFKYPIMNVGLDIDFNETTGLPPGTPMAIDILTEGIDQKYREGEKENIQRIQ
jgi:hypothetical protein